MGSRISQLWTRNVVSGKQTGETILPGKQRGRRREKILKESFHAQIKILSRRSSAQIIVLRIEKVVDASLRCVPGTCELVPWSPMVTVVAARVVVCTTQFSPMGRQRCGLSAPIATTDVCQLVCMCADRVLFQCSSCCPSCCPCPMPALNTITTVPAQHSQTTETVTATRSPLHASQLHASKLHICAHLRCTYSTSARSPSPLASV